MIWNQENFSAKPALIAQIQDGDIFHGGSFAQDDEDSTIIENIKSLIFYETNLRNVILHPSCKVYGVNSSKASVIHNEDGTITVTPKGKRDHVKMNDSEVDDVLADDNLNDIVFYAINRNKIRKARKNKGKPEKPPLIPKDKEDKK